MSVKKLLYDANRANKNILLYEDKQCNFIPRCKYCNKKLEQEDVTNHIYGCPLASDELKNKYSWEMNKMKADIDKLEREKEKYITRHCIDKEDLPPKIKSIPKTVINTVWNDEFGDSGVGRCIVCHVSIKRDNFDCGHIVSVNEGGSNNVNNLKPICRPCNASMGTTNMYEFKTEYFDELLDNGEFMDKMHDMFETNKVKQQTCEIIRRLMVLNKITFNEYAAYSEFKGYTHCNECYHDDKSQRYRERKECEESENS
jgi:hypothetical protein